MANVNFNDYLLFALKHGERATANHRIETDGNTCVELLDVGTRIPAWPEQGRTECFIHSRTALLSITTWT